MILVMTADLKGPVGVLLASLLLPPIWSCDPALTRLFTPAHPRQGRYEICTTSDPIETIVAGDGQVRPPRAAPIDTVQALDAFGGAGAYDRSALARLYGGNRVKVARGWTQDGGRFESVTFISPYPDVSLTRLMPGTMVIRWLCDAPAAACHGAACR